MPQQTKAIKKPKRNGRPEYGTVEHDRLMHRNINKVRASVLGANDGVVSIAALVIGVAAAPTMAAQQIAIAGFAGLAAGALSMAAGEFVSVSSQRDTEDAQLARERKWHEERPEWELEQLVKLNISTGMSEKVARLAAHEQTKHDPIAAHARMHLGITDTEVLTRPIQASMASLVAFTVGGTIPILTILLFSPALRIPLTFAIAIACVAGTGAASASIVRAPRKRAMLRNVIGGILALSITYGIGTLVGFAV
jgi:VIT1/CCC1 family predicted Fe2+/Mn2+ transporter